MSQPTSAGMTNLGTNPWNPNRGHGIPFRSLSNMGASGNTGAYAAKGNHIRPLVPVILHSLLIATIGTAANDVYQGLVGEYNPSTNQLVNINLSNSFTIVAAATTTRVVMEFDFGGPLFLKPNVDYLFAALITSGSDTTACKISTDYVMPVEFPAVSLGQAVLAKKSPATSDTWTFTAGTLASIGAVGYFFPWGL